MKNIGIAFLFMVLVILAMFMISAQTDRDHAEINTWATTNGYHVVSISREGLFWHNTPFHWNQKNDRIYSVVVSDSLETEHTSYFRFRARFFSPEMEQTW